MRPVRIHLDTSDYGAMHAAAPGTEVARIREHLTGLAAAGQVEIACRTTSCSSSSRRPARSIGRTGWRALAC